ncbi:MAG: hypothetical protein A2202_00560 [Bdellovibrionales bacterium RIFOXYA1_FULL_36_14]|nr:MAG: hypothetical protein A2202_00560 [Bdellovibrionales bacterium RIFOXYA1_FULL_36_14]
MKLTIIICGWMVTFNLYASSNYCSFIGSNTQMALQYTNELISDLSKLKTETNCAVSDRSFQSLDDITKFYSYYLEHRSQEAGILLQKEQLEQLYNVYNDASSVEERTSVMNEMLSSQSSLIENEASLKISSSDLGEEFKKTNIQNLVMEISNVINDVSMYEGCFAQNPARAASILGGMINLTGSVAGLAGLNPLWAGVGNTIGSLVTQLGQAIRNYQWKYIDDLDKTALFYNLICMIEMQSNYYCEKQTEISLIKELMRIDLVGEDNQSQVVWKGIDIQSESLPVFQSWIKRLYYGTPAANTTDAYSQNMMLKQINSAEAILNLVHAKYKEMIEKMEEGGDKFNLIRNYTQSLQILMTGMSTSTGAVESEPGTVYFTQRFNAGLMNYILVAPPEIAGTITTSPACPDNDLNCDRFIVFLKIYYGNPPTSDESLKSIITNMEKNIQMISTTVSKDMDRDLLKRRLGDPGVLLAYAEVKDTIYDLSPREGLKNLHDYILGVIVTFKKYYEYNRDEETCINLKTKAGCPTPLQEAIKIKNIIDSIEEVLQNNLIDAASRIKLLSDLLSFKDNRALLLGPKFEIILKKDLEAKIKLGEISPLEDELIHLKRQNVLETLRKEGADNDKRRALDDRQRSMDVITYNLKSFVEVKPLRKTILNEIKQIKRDFEDGILVNMDTYNEACAILLSTPYKNYSTGEGGEVVAVCKDSRIISEWNRIRFELNLGVLPELDLHYDNYYKKQFPVRACAYNTYQKKNIVYGLKDKIKMKISK